MTELIFRSESVDARQRKRTRECLIDKMGGAAGGRVRSASAGRDKRTEMAARYWAILVENLKRAVDDLFKICEGDESCMFAREVIMLLGNYTKDFEGLIKYLKMKVEYENTPLPQRPTSLTWDIRKTSPMGKVTPVSTPGKLTPTRQLLLCSPAKRQLNFEAETEAANRVRSRQVSETIKEVGLEVDCSPHQSWQDLQKVVDATTHEVIKVSDESEENFSEHEKSDSEQEKDCNVINEPTNKIEEVSTQEDQMVQSTDSTISDKSESNSKDSSDGDSARAKKVNSKSSKVVTKSSVGGGAKTASSGTKPIGKLNSRLQDKSVKSATGSINSSKPSASTANVVKKSEPETLKSFTRPTSSFASTVKSSSTKSVASSSTSTITKPQSAPASNPRITRAKTTISSSNKPSSAPAAATRKTAAGLLITTTARKAASSSAAASGTSSKPSSRPSSTNAAGSSSPKQQRLSLVARQSIFASEKKNPNKKSIKLDSGKSRLGAGGTGNAAVKNVSDGNNNNDQRNPAGSNTSLSSGSSNRSWADTVRVGLGLSHHSVEDLTLNLNINRYILNTYHLSSFYIKQICSNITFQYFNFKNIRFQILFI